MFRFWKGSSAVLLILLVFTAPPFSYAGDVPFDFETSKDASIYSFFLTADGKTLVLGGQLPPWLGFGGGWALWDVPTGKRLRKVPMENGNAHSVAISPDGKLLAAGGDGAELKLFDPATGKVVGELRGHRACLHQVAFTPDGKYLVTAAGDNMLRVWRIKDRSPVANYRFTSKIQYHNGWKDRTEEPDEKAKVTVTFDELVYALEFFAISPAGDSLAVTGGTNKVKLLDLLTGKVLKTFTTEKKEGALSVAFTPDGKTLAVGGACEDGIIELWDVEGGKRRATLKGHKYSVLCLAFSPDGATLLSGGLEDGARVWDVASRKQKYHIRRPKKDDRVVGVAFMPGGKTFVTAWGAKPVAFWDLATGHKTSPLSAPAPK